MRESKKHRGAYVTSLPEEAYCDNWVANNGLQFLRNFPDDQPWHLVINFTGPHNPMDVTQRMHDAWKDVQFPPPVENTQPAYSAEDHQRNRQHYAAMIENIDRLVGQFIEVVKQRGELDNTLIVYASDHGEMLGDHNKWGKVTWYTPSSGIPLIVAGPDITQGLTSSALVSLHDLTATFLDYAGIAPLPAMESRTLRGVLEGQTDEHRQRVFSGLGDWRMVFDGQYKLVIQSGAAPILFDIKADPQEMDNVAEMHPDVVARLTPLLKPEISYPERSTSLNLFRILSTGIVVGLQLDFLRV